MIIDVYIFRYKYTHPFLYLFFFFVLGWDNSSLRTLQSGCWTFSSGHFNTSKRKLLLLWALKTGVWDGTLLHNRTLKYYPLLR